MCVYELFGLRVLHTAQRAALSGPVVGKQEVLVFAGEAEFEVPERTAGSVERPDAHQEQDDVGGNQAGNILGVLEGLHEKRNRYQQKYIQNNLYFMLFSSFFWCQNQLYVALCSAIFCMYLKGQ